VSNTGVETVRLRYQVATVGRAITMLCALLSLAIITAAFCLMVGTELTSPAALWSAISGSADSALRTIVLDLRLPRIALAAGVGAALASCGVLFQAMLRNPLAEPYILGLSNGCAVGAILGYFIGIGQVGVTALSFAGGALVIFTVLMISRGSFGVRSEAMLLSGVMVDAVTAAMIFLLLHFLGDQVRSAVQWLLGDLSNTPTWVAYASIALLAALLIGSLYSGNILNALALGDDEAASLGLNVERTKTVLYLIASFVVGVTVSFCGTIGFIGLVVPHILRRIVGPDHRLLLPASVLGGAIFLMLCDALSRAALPAIRSTGGELPVGAITALVGAPLFIYLLRTRARE
jgi:iron complex transport system permease protein